jgi:hypothetical protein
MMLSNWTLKGLVALVGVLGATVGAFADQITYGPSAQAITYTGNGSGGITATSAADTADNPATHPCAGITACSVEGPANFIFGPLLTQIGGRFAFTQFNVTAGPYNSGLFPVSSQTAQIFAFNDTAGDALTGSVHWNVIEDDTPQPKFFGTITLTFVNAVTPDFGTDFINGHGYGIDFTSNTISGCSVPANCLTVHALANSTDVASATISSGEVSVPGPLAGAGLPGLLAACGGLLALARRRRKLA